MNNNFTLKQFGLNIKSRREAKGFTQAELAELLNISPTQLSSIETGKSKTSFDVIVGLCDHLDVTPDYLFMGFMHSNNISKDLEDLIRTLPDKKKELLYLIAIVLRDN